MNQTDIQRLAHQLTLYRTEAAAKRRNLLDEMKTCETENWIYNAERLNTQSMMIIRTDAKAVAIEELAQALGVAAEVREATDDPA